MTFGEKRFNKKLDKIRRLEESGVLAKKKKKSRAFNKFLSNKLAVNVFDCTDVKSAGRLNSNKKFGVSVDFTGNNYFLNITTRQHTYMLFVRFTFSFVIRFIPVVVSKL